MVNWGVRQAILIAAAGNKGTREFDRRNLSFGVRPLVRAHSVHGCGDFGCGLLQQHMTLAMATREPRHKRYPRQRAHHRVTRMVNSVGHAEVEPISKHVRRAFKPTRGGSTLDVRQLAFTTTTCTTFIWRVK